MECKRSLVLFVLGKTSSAVLSGSWPGLVWSGFRLSCSLHFGAATSHFGFLGANFEQYFEGDFWVVSYSLEGLKYN